MAAVAAVAVAFALLSLVDKGFTPAADARGVAADARRIEVAIEPSRIEVVGVRARDLAQGEPAANSARVPRS